MKPDVLPPPYSDIDPNEKNSECAYCSLKFVGNHAYVNISLKITRTFINVAPARISFHTVIISTIYISVASIPGLSMKNQCATRLA